MNINYAECDFESHDLLYPYKDDIIEQYLENSKILKSNNVPYTNTMLENHIIPKIKEIVNSKFRMKIENITCYSYVQNHEICKPYFHHHMRCRSNSLDPPLTAALYLDPPEMGGEFQFLPNIITPETFDADLKKFTFKVNKDTLYFFPSWYMHRPLPQQDETYRVCLSFNIYSYDRPEFLPGKVIW